MQENNSVSYDVKIPVGLHVNKNVKKKCFAQSGQTVDLIEQNQCDIWIQHSKKWS